MKYVSPQTRLILPLIHFILLCGEPLIIVPLLINIKNLDEKL